VTAPADSALRAALREFDQLAALYGWHDLTKSEPSAIDNRTQWSMWHETRRKIAAIDSKPSADSERLREAAEYALRAMRRQGWHENGAPGMVTAEAKLRAALEATPPDSGSRLPPDPAPLDVERLAKAFHLAQRWCDGTESSTWRTDSAADQDATALAIHGDDAKAVAREYAALSGKAPSPPTGCPDPEHPDGAYCFGTTGLPSCYPPEVRSPLDYSGEAPSPVAEPRE
jgi:hypothetical protein